LQITDRRDHRARCGGPREPPRVDACARRPRGRRADHEAVRSPWCAHRGQRRWLEGADLRDASAGADPREAVAAKARGPGRSHVGPGRRETP